jgi:hypothetical protein
VIANEQQDPCSRKCGVHTISHPFQLENNSPPECGDQRYTLSCENNQLILYYRKCQIQEFGYLIKKEKSCQILCTIN